MKLITLDRLSTFYTALKGVFVAKVDGKGLSTNDYTTAEKNKLSGIASSAQVNVIESIKVNGTALTPSSKAVNIDLRAYATTSSLSNYAKKSDISGAYIYKGTVESYSKLPTSGQTAGDVYNITAADSSHGIKAGDNVAWTGSDWDVLAGTVDLSAYATTSALSAGLAAKQNKLTAGSNITISSSGTISATNTTYSDMKAATSSAAGTHGLVPAPAAGKQNSFLRGDGTWAVPAGTAYNDATASTHGLMSAADKTKLDGMTECTEAEIIALFS